MTKVLLTGGGGAGNEALFSLLEKHYELHFGDADIAAIDPIIPKTRCHRLPWASDPNFVDAIKAVCSDLKIDIIIPGVDEELAILARNSKKLAPTRLLLPSAEYVNIMLDKLKMIQALKAKQIPVPLSCTLDEDIGSIKFPCISKPRNGRGSRDVKVLNSLHELKALKSVLGTYAQQILVQEKINGVEYTVQMVANSEGSLAAVIPVKVQLKKGITLRAKTETEVRVISACKQIHNAIPARGIYNIQLILTSEGKVFPFEINPRISTTLCLVVAAGIDPIALYTDLTNRKTELLPFTAGIHLQRHWKNVFSQQKDQ